jgi:hypothetical protein
MARLVPKVARFGPAFEPEIAARAILIDQVYGVVRRRPHWQKNLLPCAICKYFQVLMMALNLVRGDCT